MYSMKAALKAFSLEHVPHIMRVTSVRPAGASCRRKNHVDSKYMAAGKTIVIQRGGSMGFTHWQHGRLHQLWPETGREHAQSWPGC